MDSAQKSISSLVDVNDIVQTKLNLFVKDLHDFGLSKEQVESLTSSLAVTATEQTIAKISAVMNEQDWDNWKTFVDTGANMAQQLIVLNRLLENKTNKDLNAIHTEILEGLVQTTMEDLNRTKDMTNKIAKLSPEDVAKAQELLDAGDFEAADQIINKE